MYFLHRMHLPSLSSLRLRLACSRLKKYLGTESIHVFAFQESASQSLAYVVAILRAATISLWITIDPRWPVRLIVMKSTLLAVISQHVWVRLMYPLLRSVYDRRLLILPAWRVKHARVWVVILYSKITNKVGSMRTRYSQG